MLENKFPENQKEQVLFPCVSQLRETHYLGHSIFFLSSHGTSVSISCLTTIVTEAKFSSRTPAPAAFVQRTVRHHSDLENMHETV